MRYTVAPAGDGRYQISHRPHPKSYIFTLIDKPVSDAAYRAATAADYGDGGLFLDRIIVNKIVDGQMWRFNGAIAPPCFESFVDGRRIEEAISGDAATAVSKKFKMERTAVARALDTIAKREKT